jgi:hypothetical protein
MIGPLVVTVGILGAGLVAGAAPVHADGYGYLYLLGHGDTAYPPLSPEALLREGVKVCDMLNANPPGSPSARKAATTMVQADMSVPDYTSRAIVTAAVRELGC